MSVTKGCTAIVTLGLVLRSGTATAAFSSLFSCLLRAVCVCACTQLEQTVMQTLEDIGQFEIIGR
jgi:hypothetical protein